MTISYVTGSALVTETNYGGPYTFASISNTAGDLFALVAVIYDTSATDGNITPVFGGVTLDKAIEYYDSTCDGHVSVWYTVDAYSSEDLVISLGGVCTDFTCEWVKFSTTLDTFALDGTPVSNTGGAGDPSAGVMAYVAGSVQLASMLDDQTDVGKVAVGDGVEIYLVDVGDIVGTQYRISAGSGNDAMYWTDADGDEDWVVAAASFKEVAVAIITLDTLTLVGSPESLGDVTPGAISQLLDALTLAGSLESLAVSPEVVNVVANALTLVSSLESLGDVTPGIVSLVVNTLTLAGSAEALTVSAGAISQLLDTLTLVSNAESIDIKIAISVLLNALTLASSLESLGDVTPGAISQLLDVLTLASNLESLGDVIPGAVTINVTDLTLASTLESLGDVTPGAASVVLASLTLSGAVESITIGTAGELIVSLDTLSLVSSLESSTLSPGTVSIVLDELTLTVSAESAEVVPGGVSLTVNTITLTSSLGSITFDASVSLILQTLELSSSAEDMSLSSGSISIPVDTLTLASSLEDLLVVLSGLILGGQVDISDTLISDIIAATSLIHSMEDSDSNVSDVTITDGEG